MLYKKPLLKTAIVTLLLTFLSNSSFAYTESPYGSVLENEHDEDYSHDYSYDYTDSEEERPSNFYMSFNYSKTMPKVGPFNVTENNIQKTESSKNLDYKNDFAGNAAIGYRTGNMRVELEGHASSANTQIELKNQRKSMISFDGPEKGKSYVVKILTNDAKEVFHGSKHDFSEFEHTDPQYKKLFVDNIEITNEGFQNKAAMINAYYDFKNSSSFTPYLGVGGGLANIKFFGMSKMKPAIQGKFGLHYNVSDKVQLSAGYRYFTALSSSSFSKVIKDEVSYQVQEKRYDAQTQKYLFDTVKVVDLSKSATVESKFVNHALEVGLIFNF